MSGGRGQFIDLTGRKFGRLRVIDRVVLKGSIVKWQCACSCGKTHIAASINLRNGWTKSCGCLRQETAKQRARARARRGGFANAARLVDPAYREGEAPASRHADAPPKRWIGAADALRELAFITASAYLPALARMPVRGVKVNLCLEGAEE